MAQVAVAEAVSAAVEVAAASVVAQEPAVSVVLEEEEEEGIVELTDQITKNHVAT